MAGTKRVRRRRRISCNEKPPPEWMFGASIGIAATIRWTEVARRWRATFRHYAHMDIAT
jgi:hypothetical protein